MMGTKAAWMMRCGSRDGSTPGRCLNFQPFASILLAEPVRELRWKHRWTWKLMTDDQNDGGGSRYPVGGSGMGWKACLLLCAALAFHGDVGAAEGMIPARLEVDATGRSVVRHAADPASYYILYRGAEITQIVSAVDMALGVPVEGRLVDGPATLDAAFYQVREVPIASPLDSDGDGIDDVWELRFRRPGAALNPADAQEDHDGSGSSDLSDYQLPVASFATANSMVIAADSRVVQVVVHF